MLTRIGTHPRPAEDVVDLLAECHVRIRSFGDLAVLLAAAKDPSVDEVRNSAEGVRRYFAEALPLHVADEEESILPRLAGRDPAVDKALVSMHREHGADAPTIGRVVDLCATLAERPGAHRELAADLATAAQAMREALERHLVGEEETIFPAIRRVLSEDDRARMIAELRARRTPAHSSR
jgi:hemerythrin-like domain-containing protein